MAAGVFFEFCRMRGGDKAPLPREAKAARRLMHDSHNAKCGNPDLVGALALDATCGGDFREPSRRMKPENIRGDGTEPFACQASTHSKGDSRSGAMGTGRRSRGVGNSAGLAARTGQGQAMGQQLQSMAIRRQPKTVAVDADRHHGRSFPTRSSRRLPCSPSVLIALRAQLARPAAPHAYGASASACETKPVRLYSPAICSRGRLPRSSAAQPGFLAARYSRASSAPRPGAW